MNLFLLFSGMSPHGTSKHWKTLGSCLCTSQAASGASLAPYVFNKTSLLPDTNSRPKIFFYAQDYVIICRRHLTFTSAISEIQSCFFLLQKTRKRFLKGFMPRLRRNRTQKRKLKKLFKQISSSRPKRGAGTEGWAAVLAFHIIVKGWQTQTDARECLMRLSTLLARCPWRLHSGQHHPVDSQWGLLPLWLWPDTVWPLPGTPCAEG